jgi:hypothetical protein
METRLRGVTVTRLKMPFLLLLLAILAAVPAVAADPPPAPAPWNPLNAFKRSPFSAEFEVYSGGITGDSVGAAYKTVTSGDYGARFTFGFMRAINFSLDYMYSNQDRTFTAVTPPVGTLPTGTLLMRAANLNMAFGSGEIYYLQTKRAKFYISPGVGFVRNGARSMTFITPLGTASSPILPGTAVTFNLGTGVKIYPWKHLGFRFDVRDHVSGGGTGSLGANGLCSAIVPPPPECVVNNAQQFFGSIPVQNNLVFTLGLIFKII